MSVVEADWDYYRDTNIGVQNDQLYETRLISLISNLENYFKSRTYINSNNSTISQDHDLKLLMDINMNLSNDVDKKQEHYLLKKDQFDNYKKDQARLIQEIKNTYEAFIMAKKYFKRSLKIYYTIEAKSDSCQTVYIQFFTEFKKESNNFSVSLLRNINTGCYEIVKTTPNLVSLKEIQMNLRKSADVPGALCFIRQAFLDLNVKKT